MNWTISRAYGMVTTSPTPDTRMEGRMTSSGKMARIGKEAEIRRMRRTRLERDVVLLTTPATSTFIYS